MEARTRKKSLFSRPQSYSPLQEFPNIMVDFWGTGNVFDQIPIENIPFGVHCVRKNAIWKIRKQCRKLVRSNKQFVFMQNRSRSQLVQGCLPNQNFQHLMFIFFWGFASHISTCKTFLIFHLWVNDLILVMIVSRLTKDTDQQSIRH